MDKKKLNPLARFRGFIQAGATLLTNIHLPNFAKGTLYQGSGKYVCVPGLNCYSCPGAAGACPVGAFQAVVGSSKFRFSYYITGILILFGVLLGRFICGFLCPFGWFQELLHKIPSPKFSTKKLKPLRYLKYAVLLVMVVLLPLLAVNELGMGDPFFCKYLCPQGVLEGAKAVADKLTAAGLRVKFDDRDNVTPGWKFNEWEMKGVPVRIEIGPRDIENGVVTVVRRDTLEKFTMPIQGIGENLVKLMADIHQTMYDMALEHRKAHTTHAENFGDFMDGVKKGFVKAPWCADPDCEMEIKCVTGASTRCKPMDEDTTVKPGCKCVFCNREAKTMMYFARAY